MFPCSIVFQCISICKMNMSMIITNIQTGLIHTTYSSCCILFTDEFMLSAMILLLFFVLIKNKLKKDCFHVVCIRPFYGWKNPKRWVFPLVWEKTQMSDNLICLFDGYRLNVCFDSKHIWIFRRECMLMLIGILYLFK